MGNRKTKIVATLGPTTSSYKEIKNLILSGVDVIRINASHGNEKDNQQKVDFVKKVRKSLGNRALPIMLDTRGPEIRIGKFENDKVHLTKNSTFIFTADQNFLGTQEKVAIKQAEIIKSIKVGHTILACNGLISFKVISVSKDEIICKVRNGGELMNNKSLFIPNLEYCMPYLNDEDKADLLWAIKNNIEYIAASFISSKNDIFELRKFMQDNNANIEIIAKIENKLAVKNLDEIIESADAIMVARGDLGVEIAQEKLPELQKTIIKKSHLAGKMVITATEMLESMIYSPRPTRAETSDVANAVYDGTSAVMLSGETAIGKYATSAVTTMAKICLEAEKNIDFKDRFKNRELINPDVADVMSDAAVHVSFMLKEIKAIAVYTDSGHTAKMLSRFYPSCPILAFTPNELPYHRMGMVWGVQPILSGKCDTADELIQTINSLFVKNKIAKVGDTILIGSGSRTPSSTDMIKIHKIV